MSTLIRGSALLVRIAAPAVVAVSLAFVGAAQVGNATAYATPIRVQADGGDLQKSGTVIHDLTGSNAQQGNQSSNGDITQTHELVGDNVTQANQSSSGGISPVHDLTGDNITQANQSSTGDIAQTHALSGQDATQANQSNSGGIAQTHTLTGGNSAQAAQSSSGAITQTHVLAADPATQSNVSSSGGIVLPSPAADYWFVSRPVVELTELVTLAALAGLDLESNAAPITQLKTEALYVH